MGGKLNEVSVSTVSKILLFAQIASDTRIAGAAKAEDIKRRVKVMIKKLLAKYFIEDSSLFGLYATCLIYSGDTFSRKQPSIEIFCADKGCLKLL